MQSKVIGLVPPDIFKISAIFYSHLDFQKKSATEVRDEHDKTFDRGINY